MQALPKLFDPETSRLIQSVSGWQVCRLKKYTDKMNRDLPAWALQENSDHKIQGQISSSRPIADQSEVSCAPLATLMTISETAAILRLATRSIRRMIERGELKAVRVGRSIRIRQQDIREIISEVK